MIEALRLPTRTAITVLVVIPEHVFLGGLTLRALGSAAALNREAEEKKAAELAQSAEERLSTIRLKATSVVRRGNPAKVLLRTADETDFPRFPLRAPLLRK